MQLVDEYLRLVAADDYAGFGALLTDDCRFTLMPSGRSWTGRERVMRFVTAAGASRSHDERSHVTITNWFSDGEQLVVEYEHRALVLGRRLRIDGYCWVLQIRDGRFDAIREYINPSGFALGLAMPILLRLAPLLTRRARASDRQP